MRIDHYLGKMGLEEVLHLRERDPGPSGAATTSTASRSPWRRTSGSTTAAASDRSVRCAMVINHLMQLVAAAASSHNHAATCRRSRSRRWRCSAPSWRPTRPITSAASTAGTRTSRAWHPARPLDARRLAARHRELALGRCAVPDRQTAADDPDRVATRLQTPATSGFLAEEPRPRPNQLVIKFDPSTGIRFRSTRAVPTSGGSARSSSTSSPPRAARVTPCEVLLTPP